MNAGSVFASKHVSIAFPIWFYNYWNHRHNDGVMRLFTDLLKHKCGLCVLWTTKMRDMNLQVGKAQSCSSELSRQSEGTPSQRALREMHSPELHCHWCGKQRGGRVGVNGVGGDRVAKGNNTFNECDVYLFFSFESDLFKLSAKNI